MASCLLLLQEVFEMRYAKMPDEPEQPILEAETPVTRRPRAPARIDSDGSDDSEVEVKEQKFNELNEQVDDG